MNKVSIFEHPEFGRIRTLEIDGKIWFCASDVAAALGYSNPRDAVVRHCKPMGVVVYDTPTRSAVQKIKYISEGNVYRLIAGSKLPSAEKFESWIFDELVPETLKNGGYLLKKNGETDNELLARAILLAQNRIKERDSRISALEKENNYAILKLKLQAPKVQYYDKVLQSQSTYTTTQIAKELGMTAILPLAFRLQMVHFAYKTCISFTNRAFEFTNLRFAYNCCSSFFKCHFSFCY